MQGWLRQLFKRSFYFIQLHQRFHGRETVDVYRFEQFTDIVKGFGVYIKMDSCICGVFGLPCRAE